MHRAICHVIVSNVLIDEYCQMLLATFVCENKQPLSLSLHFPLFFCALSLHCGMTTKDAGADCEVQANKDVAADKPACEASVAEASNMAIDDPPIEVNDPNSEIEFRQQVAERRQRRERDDILEQYFFLRRGGRKVVSTHQCKMFIELLSMDCRFSGWGPRCVKKS